MTNNVTEFRVNNVQRQCTNVQGKKKITFFTEKGKLEVLQLASSRVG